MLDREMLRQTTGFLQHYNIFEKNKDIYNLAIDEFQNDSSSAFSLSLMIAEHLEGRDLAIYPYWLSIASHRGSSQAQYLLSTYYLDHNEEEKAMEIFALMSLNTEMPAISRRYALETLSLYHLKKGTSEDRKITKEGFETILNEDKRNKKAYYYLSYCYLMEKDIEKAKDRYQEYEKLCHLTLDKTKEDPEHLEESLK